MDGAAGAPPQAVVQPSSTPAKNGRRYLLWNMTGLVISRDENVFSAVEVEFNSIDKHRPIRLTAHDSFSMAALNDEEDVLLKDAVHKFRVSPPPR